MFLNVKACRHSWIAYQAEDSCGEQWIPRVLPSSCGVRVHHPLGLQCLYGVTLSSLPHQPHIWKKGDGRGRSPRKGYYLARHRVHGMVVRRQQESSEPLTRGYHEVF
jgi:hypothetical protein